MEMSWVLIKELGFIRSAANHSVFICKRNKEHTIIAVATDDMAITTKRATDAETFKQNIRKYWDITNNGPIRWFLGFQIKRDRKNKTLSINQHSVRGHQLVHSTKPDDSDPTPTPGLYCQGTSLCSNPTPPSLCIAPPAYQFTTIWPPYTIAYAYGPTTHPFCLCHPHYKLITEHVALSPVLPTSCLSIIRPIIDHYIHMYTNVHRPCTSSISS